MYSLLLLAGMAAVCVFFVYECRRWKVRKCGACQRRVRTGLFVLTELCLGSFLLFPHVKKAADIRLMLWYLGLLLFFMLLLLVLLFWDLMLTRSGFCRK